MDSMTEFRHSIDTTMHRLMHVLPANSTTDGSSVDSKGQRKDKLLNQSALESIGRQFQTISSIEEAHSLACHLTSCDDNDNDDDDDDDDGGNVLSKLSIPTNLLKSKHAHADGSSKIMHLPHQADAIKKTLGQGKMSIVVNGTKSVGPLSTEQLGFDSMCINGNDDDIKGSVQHDEAQQKMMFGNAIYCKLLRRTARFVSDSDLLLTPDHVHSLSEHAIGLAYMMSEEYCKNIIDTGLQKIFGTNSKGGRITIKPRKLGVHTIYCRVGGIESTTGFCGLGVEIVTKTSRSDVYLRPLPQSNEDDEDTTGNRTRNVNHVDQVFTVDCKIVQCFPLINENGGNSNLYFDCSAEAGDHALIVAPTSADYDYEHGFLVVSLVPTNHSNENSIRRKPTNRSSLSNVVSQITDDESNNNTTDLVDEKIGVGSALHAFGRYLELADDWCKQGAEESSSVTDTQIIPFNSLFLTERVVSVSTSLCHSLLLTTFGTVYSCGDSSDGQLGHGNLSGCKNFQVIDWFLQRNIIVSNISAGADQVRSHSAAITNEGRLYTWGHAAICGHAGKAHGKDLPRGSNKSVVFLPTPIESFENMKVLKVSCGGSFTVAVVKYDTADGVSTMCGKRVVYSWGVLSKGRLGIGNINNFRINSKQGYPKSGRLPIYQKRPTCLTSLDECVIVDVSAGRTHALALSSEGKVFAWGENTSGQCSFESSKSEEGYCPECSESSSIWDDIYVPHEVPIFGAKNQALSIAAGPCHSAATDSKGRLWIWGTNDKKHHTFKTGDDTSDYTRSLLSGYCRPPSFLSPRIVKSLQGENVKKVCLGEENGLAITLEGQIYTWGCFDKNTDDACTLPTLPTPKKFPSLIGMKISDADLSGKHFFALEEGPIVKECIGLQLWKKRNVLEIEPSFWDSYDEEKSLEMSEAVSESSFIDCAIIVGHKKILCHKAILACRSSMFKDIITRQTSHPSNFSVLNIFLTNVDFESAMAMIYYIYTDTLCVKHIPSPSRIRTLMLTAEKYSVYRLSEMCRKILECGVSDRQDSIFSPSTIAADFARMINNPIGADLRLLVSGKLIYAHRCVLASRSTFFSSMIPQTESRLDTVELSGSYESIMRTIVFMYTGMVPSGEVEDLLEDISHAKRYGIMDLVRQCECFININSKNAVGFLSIALENDLNKMKQSALTALAKDLTTVSKNIGDIVLAYPGIASELFELIKEYRGPLSIIPRDRLAAADGLIEMAKKKKNEQIERASDDIMKGLSLHSFAGLVLSLFISLLLISVFPPGPWVLVMNATFLICLVFVISM